MPPFWGAARSPEKKWRQMRNEGLTANDSHSTLSTPSSNPCLWEFILFSFLHSFFLLEWLLFSFLNSIFFPFPSFGGTKELRNQDGWCRGIRGTFKCGLSETGFLAWVSHGPKSQSRNLRAYFGVCLEDSISTSNDVLEICAQKMSLSHWTDDVVLALHQFISYKVQI